MTEHERKRVLLLDVMGTLVHDPFFAEIPAFFSMSLQELIAAKHPRAWLEFELGQMDERELLASFFADGRSFDGEALKAKVRAAYRYLDGIEPLLVELSARGLDMHALSNYSCWYRLIEDALCVSRHVQWTFVSCKTGVRKPDPQAYLGAARALGVEPGACVFVDDREINCEGARAVGMVALRFGGAARLREDLRGLGWL